MNKRPYNGAHGSHSHKKHKHHDDRHDDRHSSGYMDRDAPPRFSSRLEQGRHDNGNRPAEHNREARVEYQDALGKLPPPTSVKAEVPAYTPFAVSKHLPALPPIKEGPLSTAPFTHKSTAHYDRSSTAGDVTYERLEFLGDAYLELFASRLIYHHYPSLPAGAQSQLRELLVKNETLAEYAKAYGFEKRVHVDAFERMKADGKDRGNKGLNKVFGDVFEAYIAAVILSDQEHGFAEAEKWLTALWAPKLLSATQDSRHPISNPSLQAGDGGDPLRTYNPTAKAELQKRILGPDVKLDYVVDKPSVELKGDQLGQNRHFIALYLTGYGHERKLLGKGEGKNKVEAGNWAATEAMYGERRGLIEECEEVLRKRKAEKERARTEKEKRERKEGGQG